MSNSYLGDPSSGDGRSGSSRKGKKSNSDKPKQPQRGLGVAQLEKLRLENQIGGCYLPSLHGPPHTNLNQMSFGDMETTDIRYGDSHSGAIARATWNQTSSVLQPQQAAQANVTRQFLALRTEDSTQKKRRQDRCDSMGSTSQNSDARDAQELDLDLKL
ncbi:protein SPEAR1-like [Magnolia sinica]|uniref:protein SPEAR1-like n=1 Tax=Magnolia sinica TaxID=86752 RepID=UPI00265B3650|nr:protein SPEAR1-like [Magnolia sinica]